MPVSEKAVAEGRYMNNCEIYWQIASLVCREPVSFHARQHSVLLNFLVFAELIFRLKC